MASFQKREASPLRHGMPSPVSLVPPPESLHAPSPDEYAQMIYQRIVKADPTQKPLPIVVRTKENDEEFLKSISEEYAQRAIDFRYVKHDQVASNAQMARPTEYRQYMWFKANGTISDDPNVHTVALAYASDHNLLSTTLRSHSKWGVADTSVMVSLDHNIYFHEVLCLENKFNV